MKRAIPTRDDVIYLGNDMVSRENGSLITDIDVPDLVDTPPPPIADVPPAPLHDRKDEKPPRDSFNDGSADA
jgi:hypothetical protein